MNYSVSWSIVRLLAALASGLLYVTDGRAQCPTITAPNVYICGGSGDVWIVATSSITSGLNWEWSVDNASVIVNTSPNTSHNNVDFAFTYGTGTSTVHITNLPASDYAIAVRAKRSGCSNPNWKDVYVFQASNPTVTGGAPVSVCANATAISLTGASPSGGTWSGPGVTGGSLFTPSIPLIGNQQVFYTYTDPTTNCQGVAARTVTVKEVPVLPTQNVCKTFRAYVLEANTAGSSGTWSGSNVSNGIFDPSSATVGNNTVTYSYLMSNGCSGSANMTIHVYDHSPISAPNLSSPTVSNCGPAASTFSVGNPGNTYTSFLWYDNGSLILSSPGVAYSSHTYTTPVLSASRQYSVQAVVDGDGDCATEPASATALINPIPAQPSVNNGSNCSDGVASVSIANPNTTVFNYAWFTVAGAPISNGSTISGIDYAITGSGTVVGLSNVPNQDVGIQVKAIHKTSGCQSPLANATVTYRSLPTVDIDNSIPLISCTNLTPFVPSAGSPTGGSWFLQDTSTNPPFNTSFTHFDPYLFGVGNKRIVYSFTDQFGCTNAAFKDIAVQSIEPPIGQSFIVPYGVPAFIAPALPPTGYTYSWYQGPISQSPLATGNSWTTTEAVDSVSVFYLATKSNSIPNCESLVRVPITVKPNRKPFVRAGADKTIVSPTPVRLNGVCQDPDGTIASFHWTQVSGPPYQLPSTQLTTKLYLAGLAEGTYVFRLTATDNLQYSESDDVSITVITAPPNNRNFVFKEVLQKDSVYDEGTVEGLTADDKLKSGQYIDGIGRNTQSLQWRVSPAQKDLVDMILYDKVGRDSVHFLPYAAGTGNGMFKTNFINDQAGFYLGTEGVAVDSRPYTKTFYEPSPLGRVRSTLAPGEAWQAGGTHAVDKQYVTNSANSILNFKYSPDSGAEVSLTRGMEYFAAGALSCVVTIDEDEKLVREFTDNMGRLICKQVLTGSEFASTYYVYDDEGNVAVVIQPEGIKEILSSLN